MVGEGDGEDLGELGYGIVIKIYHLILRMTLNYLCTKFIVAQDNSV